MTEFARVVPPIEWRSLLRRALDDAARRGNDVFVAAIDLYQKQDTAPLPVPAKLLGTWQARLHEGEFVTRYGHEGFLASLIDRDPADAMRVIEEVRQLIPPGYTFAAGLVMWNKNEASSALLARAEFELATARESGFASRMGPWLRLMSGDE